MIGFLNVDKPTGMTSAQVVARVKKLLCLGKDTKVGHTGTLDPLASGVLPIAIGKATRLFEYMLAKTKEYEAEFRFGHETDTLDSAGKTIKTTDNIPSKQEIENALHNFIGKILQMPPAYSAKSVNGKRAYSLARKGQNVELNKCEVEVFTFDLIEEINSNTFKFKIVCGSGTYIRALCRDLAYSLGSLATMTKLVRTRVGVFNLDSACKLEMITKFSLLPCDIVLKKLESYTIDSNTLSRLRNGQKVNSKLMSNELLKIIYQDELVGLGYAENSNLKMKIWLI